MANRINASNLSDLLLPMRQRGNAPGVYFVRLCQWSPEIKDFLWRYHEAARAKGVIIEGQIGNPDERQLSYLTEMLGSAFEPNPAFITQALQKWMPRMSQANRVSFAEAMCTQMDELKRKGKTDSIIRNIYMKVMCWLYYKFERLMPFLGDDNPPRILYECNAVTAHELILLRILSMMGTDILLLEPQGDAAYLKQDAASAWSQLLSVQGMPFAKDFTLKQFRKEMAAAAAGNMRPPSQPRRAGDIRAADAPVGPRCAASGDSAEPADADTATRCAAAAQPRNILPEAVADGMHECVDEGSIL